MKFIPPFFSVKQFLFQFTQRLFKKVLCIPCFLKELHKWVSSNTLQIASFLSHIYKNFENKICSLGIFLCHLGHLVQQGIHHFIIIPNLTVIRIMMFRNLFSQLLKDNLNVFPHSNCFVCIMQMFFCYGAPGTMPHVAMDMFTHTNNHTNVILSKTRFIEIFHKLIHDFWLF